MTEGFLLSQQQRRRWLYLRQEAQPFAWVRVRIQGDLDRSQLQNALNIVVRQHEILRTRFEIPEGVTLPLQVVCDWAKVNLSETFTPRFTQEHPTAGDPVMEATLTAAEDAWFLVLQVHPLCCDRIGLLLLVQEVLEVYTTLQSGNPWQDEPVQYTQYDQWRQSLLAEDDPSGIRHWQQQASAPLQGLPFFEPPAPSSSGEWRNVNNPLKLPDLTCAGLDGETLEATLFTVWQWLLGHYLGETQVDLAICTDGRSFEELSLAQGPYSNYLPIPGKINLHSQLTEASQENFTRLKEARQFRDFFDLETSPQPTRSFGFCFQPLPTSLEAAGLSLEIEELGVTSEPFLLEWVAYVHGTTLRSHLVFNHQALREQDVHLLSNHLWHLLGKVTQPNQITFGTLLRAPVRHLPDSLTPPPPNLSLHEKIKHTARVYPDRLALASPGDSPLPYGELEVLLARVAAGLQQRGVQVGDRVAIHLPRGTSFVVAALAVLKIGAAYVPMDESWPDGRVEALLKQAAPKLVIAGEDKPQASSGMAVSLSVLGQTTAAFKQQPIPNHVPAYMIFTSGSTGEPKGVVISRANLAGYLEGLLANLDLGEGCSFATSTTLAADLGHTSVFAAFATGGTLHVLNRETVTAPTEFEAYLRQYPIDVLKMTPSHLNALAGDPQASQLPRRALILGGEALPLPWIQKLVATNPQLTVWNHYGPTEATVGVCMHRVHGQEKTRIPIGAPLTHASLVILDADGNRCPANMRGQLAIGGNTLAHGYWQRPAFTAERFRPDPFAAQPGSRLYLTGDLAFCDALGEVVFLGRNDHQVKIAGYRVELGEVEQALSQLPGVRQALAMVGEQQQLLAFVTGTISAERQKDHLQALREKLPTYMVPTQIAYLEQFPLTANKKIDRQRLLHLAKTSVGQAGLAPRTAMEQTLAKIWQDVLGKPVHDIRASFFDLGGHSLLSIQAIHKINAVYHQRLTLTHMMRYPSIQALSSFLAQEQPPTSMPIPLAQASEKTPNLYFFHPSGGEIHWYFALAQKLEGDFSCFGLEAPPLAVYASDQPDIHQLAAYHAATLRAHQPHGPYHLAGWSAGGTVALATAEILEQQGERVEEVLLIDAFRHQDESRIKLTQFALLDFLSETLRRSRQDYVGLVENLVTLEQPTPAELVERLISQGLLPQNTQRTALITSFGTYLAIRTAINAYQPTQPYLGKLRLIRARYAVHDASGFREDFNFDASLGWRQLGYSNLAIRNLRGDHYSLLQEPFVHDLADLIAGRGGRFRAGSGAISLLVEPANAQVARILKGIVGVFETQFPEAIASYYLMGSHAEGLALKESDLDLLVVFRQKPSFQTMEQAEELAAHCHFFYDHGIDFRFNSKSELERIATITGMEKMKHIYGQPIQPPPMEIQFHTNMRFRMHTSLFFLREVRYPQTVLHYPLPAPNPQDRFLGYTLQGRDADPNVKRESTRALVNILTKPAMGWLAYRAETHVINKRAVPLLFKERLDADLGAFLIETLAFCRDVWHYQVPTTVDGENTLTQLCHRTLDFENRFLRLYREFLFEELHDQRSPIPWLTIDEMVLYLAVPQSLVEAAMREGRLEHKQQDGEWLLFHPRLYRLLAINAMARIIFNDTRAQETLLGFLHEDVPFQTYLVETAMAKIERFQTLSAPSQTR